LPLQVGIVGLPNAGKTTLFNALMHAGAEVTAYAEFIKFKGEAGAKEAGKLRLEGKEYVVQDGDVMHFRFNV